MSYTGIKKKNNKVINEKDREKLKWNVQICYESILPTRLDFFLTSYV